MVLARLGRTSMVKYHWTADVPDGVSDVDLLEDLGARWEGEELVTYDLADLVERIEASESSEYLIDND